MAEHPEVPLKEHIESRIAALEKATEVARQSMDKRLDSMNEFRESLKEQGNKFVNRTEHDTLAREVRDLREAGAELRGKASQSSVLLSYGLSVLAILVSILLKLFK